MKKVVVVAVLLLAVSLIGLCYFFLRTDGDTVVVTVDGIIFGEYSLQEERTVDIRQGDHFNILIIRDGKAHIESADCPDGICVDHKPIFRDGESIVCLPNRVVVTITTNDDDNDLDIVA